MSPEERILRLENAFAAVSELAARSQEVSGQRIAELAEAQARTEAALERLSQTVETILRGGRGGQPLG